MFALLPLLLCASTLALPNSKPFYDLKDAVHHFEQFIEEYNRVYAGEEETHMRFHLFKQYLEEINRRNMMEDEHATFGIDRFADMTQEEKKSYNGLLPTSFECKLLLDGRYQSRVQSLNEAPPASCEKLVIGGECDVESEYLPDSFDWRDKNVVSAVKDQFGCGSCWTFSSTGNIEGQYALKHGNIVTFSEQQLIDCNKFNHGCNGGLLNNSFGDLIANGGIMTEEDYPYEAQEKKCRFDVDKAKAKFTKCYSLDLQNEDKLKEYLYETGPLSIALNGRPLMGYRGGVIKNCDSSEINHGVLLVGWGTEGDLPYWTIKNSWATSWGEKGFVRILRGKNTCGLMNPCAATSVLA